MKGILFLVNRMWRTGLVIILGSGMVLSTAALVSCSRAPEDPAWFQSTATGEALGPDQLAEKIERIDSLFDLYDMKREYILRGGDSREIMAELDRRRDQLVEEADAFPAIPGKLDFLGWDSIEKVGANQYRISGYFVARDKMERDWQFKIMTKVDEQHVSLLPPDRQNARYLNWPVFPKTSTWQPGEHHILSTIMKLEPIPYYIYARMFYYPELINHGEIAYGWFADPNLPPVPKDKPAP
jgi:hypothetical protein